MPDLIAVAQRGTLAQFLEHYESSMVQKVKPRSGRTLLHAAASNGDLEARLAIAHRLLDDGVDATATMTDPPHNVLHILFDAKRHDWAGEAPLVARLLDAGADVNAAAGVRAPLALLIDKGHGADPEAAIVFEAVLSHASVDFGVDVAQPGRPPKSLRDLVVDNVPAGTSLGDAARHSGP